MTAARRSTLACYTVALTVACAAPAFAGDGASGAVALTSAAFAEAQAIPAESSCQGSDRSPALAWTTDVTGIGSWTLIVDDPDAPGGTFVHWLAYDLPAQTRSLAPGVAPGDVITSGGRQGANDFGSLGYRGPCPPKGRAPHHYRFRLYALDQPTLGLPPASKKGEVERALEKHHVLASTVLTGTFERK